MRKNQLILIGIIILVVLAGFGIFFTIQDSKTNEATVDTQTVQEDFDFVKEDEAQTPSEYFDSFGLNKLKITVYGGPKDIKTFSQGSSEYALIRNPENIGGLEFAVSDDFGRYYFLKDADNQKTTFAEGTPEGKFGYNEAGLVSGILIRERIPSAEYYSSYPTSDLASKAGFEVVADTGIANRFLSNYYLKITNLNNNVSVITEIDSRNSIEDTLLVSEATRQALRLDNNAGGSFSLELVDKNSYTLGVVRI